jgi:hypothetical protein
LSNPYPICTQRMLSIEATFRNGNAHLPGNHLVIQWLKALHNYTFGAVEKAYDWYCFGPARRDGRQLIKEEKVLELLDFVRNATRGRSGETATKDMVDSVDLFPNDETRLAKLLVHLTRAKYTALMGELENKLNQSSSSAPVRISDEFWCKVAELHDAYSSTDAKHCLDDRWEVNFCALLAHYTEENCLRELMVNAFVGRHYADREEILSQAMALNAALLHREAEMVASQEWPKALHDYRGLGDADAPLPGLMTRLALGAALYATFTQGTAVIAPEDDFCNWLFHWLWRHEQRDKTGGTYAPFVYVDEKKFIPMHDTRHDRKFTEMGLCDGSARDAACKIYKWLVDPGNCGVSVEYDMANTWYETAGRGGKVQSTQKRIMRLAAGGMVREVLDSLMKPGSPWSSAAVLAAASKLGVAHMDIATESNASCYFRLWARHGLNKGLNNEAQWIGMLTDHVRAVAGKASAKGPKKLQKKAVTDVIATIAEIAHRVTGLTHGIDQVALVYMARAHFFTDVTRPQEAELREQLQHNRGWGTGWDGLEGVSGLAQATAQPPDGHPHQWLWGQKFFQAVVAALVQVLANNPASAHLHESVRYWTLHLLCIPWVDERNSQLKDRPKLSELREVIEYVVAPIAMPTCEPLQGLGPIIDWNGTSAPHQAMPYFTKRQSV